MTNSAAMDFASRLRRIDRRHRGFAHGVRAKVRSDGLMVPVAQRRRVRMPVFALLIIALSGLMAKVGMFAILGAAEFGRRVAVLADGNLAEQAGAWLLQTDPVTVAIADWIARVFA